MLTSRSLISPLLFMGLIILPIGLSRAQNDSPRPKVYAQDQVPREISSAVAVKAWLEANHIQSDLNGRSRGYLEVNVEFQTKGFYKIYDENLNFWTDPEPILGGHEWRVEILRKAPLHIFNDPLTQSPKAGYKGEAPFLLKLSLPPEGLAAPLDLRHLISLNAGFQACSDTICLFPAALKLDIRLSNKSVAPSAVSPPSLTERITQLLKKSLGSDGSIAPLTLLALLLTGVMTAFTPCVYPLYPITLGIFSRWGHDNKKISAFALVLSYCAGMVLSYASIGLLSAASGSLFGSLTQTPLFLIGTGSLILLSAIVFSGLLDFKFFSWLQNRFTSHTTDVKASALKLCFKAFGMGAVLGMVASPCVGPVLIVILAWLTQNIGAAASASASTYATGFVLLATFGVGMSLPFLVLGHLMIRMGSRPRLGRFTPIFKQLGTLLMVLAAALFLIPGIRQLTQSNAPKYTPKFTVFNFANWSKSRPTVIDFRADWCAACLELEHETFANPMISQLFESGKFDFLSHDLTQNNAENQAITRDYGIIGLPTVLITDAQGRVCKNLSLFGFENAKLFLKRLEQIDSCTP